MPAFDIRTLDDYYNAKAMMAPRLISQIVTAIGMLGLVLAVMGLYAVIAYVTARRTREIGIRMAIGASRSRVLWLVFSQATGIVSIGLGIGLTLAFLVAPKLAGAFIPMNMRDGLVFTLVPLALVAVSAVACLVPARRAAAVDPTVALRWD